MRVYSTKEEAPHRMLLERVILNEQAQGPREETVYWMMEKEPHKMLRERGEWKEQAQEPQKERILMALQGTHFQASSQAPDLAECPPHP